MSSERVLLDSSVGGLRDWWWSAHRRSGLGVWRTALHRSHGGEWWQQSTTRHWEPTSTDDWKRVMHWRRCMMDCIILESRRGALKDICHPPLKADQWHQLTLLVTELLRVVDELYDKLTTLTGVMTTLCCLALRLSKIHLRGMLMVEVVVQLTSSVADCSTL